MAKTNIELYKETGDNCYKEAVIKEYAKTVKIIAGQVYTKCPSYLLEKCDYESFGIFGLLDAIDKYDPAMNVQFDTYASHRIRGSIFDELRKFDQIPRKIRDDQKRYRELQNIATDKFGPNFTRDQLMKANKISEQELIKLEQVASIEEATSLDGLFFRCDSDEDRFDIQDNRESNSCEYTTLQAGLAAILSVALESLTEKERCVIQMIYYDDLLLAEIAVILNISESRVSQLHRKALTKLSQNKEVIKWQVV